MILVDTSVWVDHFKNKNDTLIQLLQSDFVLMHPMIWLKLLVAHRQRPDSEH